MRQGSAVALAVLLAGGANIAWADGPFGIEMGAPMSVVTGCERLGKEGQFKCKTVPKPHSALSIYLVSSSPNTGICKVAGITEPTADSGYGTELRAIADKLVTQIEATYGKATSHADFLQPGSIWDEPREWTMAVSKKQRAYQSFWGDDPRYTPINNVINISVDVAGLSSDKGFVAASFEFANFAECSKAIDAKDADAF